MDIEMVSILLTRVRTERVIGKLGLDLQCLQDFGLRVLGYRHLAFQPLHLPSHPLMQFCLPQSTALLISKLFYFLWLLNLFQSFQVLMSGIRGHALKTSPTRCQALVREVSCDKGANGNLLIMFIRTASDWEAWRENAFYIPSVCTSEALNEMI